MENSDDEALQWAGDESRMRGSGTWSVPKRDGGASSSASASGDGAQSAVGPDEVISAGASDAVERQPGSWRDSAALLVTGVVAGVYLIVTFAWVMTALRNPIRFSDSLSTVMFDLGLWFAVAAAPAVFVTVQIALRKKSPWIRILVCTLALGLLLPWPYLGWVGL